MKTVKFYTLGCKVNQYETQEIRERFLEAGFMETEDNRKADLYVINTCTVTHKADKDSLYYIHRAFHQDPKAKIVVTGCMAALDTDMLKAQAGVRWIVRNGDKHRLVDIVTGKKKKRGRGITSFKGHTRAFVKIQDGCDNCCSYCRVPLARGRSRSKKLTDICAEVRSLVAGGFKEVVLTGICLGAYGRELKPRKSLGAVIEALEKIEGLARLRLSSIEAKDVTDALLGVFARSKKLCRHLHIPIQSGDDRILKKMLRSYTRAQYCALIRKIKKRIPGIGITTDVLVGFPGESEKHFRNTFELIKKIRPLRVHIFPFSPRPGTGACALGSRPDPAVVKERLARLGELGRQCSDAYRKGFLGKNMDVLIEGRNASRPDAWEGHTDTYMTVLVRSKQDLKNQLIRVSLEAIQDDHMWAKQERLASQLSLTCPAINDILFPLTI